MAKKKRKVKKIKRGNKSLLFFGIFFSLITVTGFGVYHFVNAETENTPVYMNINKNIGIQATVEDFFNANDFPLDCDHDGNIWHLKSTADHLTRSKVLYHPTVIAKKTRGDIAMYGCKEHQGNEGNG